MSRIIYQGQLDDVFTGFDEDKLFKMSNGTFWIQSHYRYWYHYAYRPSATITDENGTYYLTVANEKIEVKQLYDVVESNIEGPFKGWNGSSVYKLRNGQTWLQSTYKYEYKYAYSPLATIYKGNSGTIMQVEGTFSHVKPKR